MFCQVYSKVANKREQREQKHVFRKCLMEKVVCLWSLAGGGEGRGWWWQGPSINHLSSPQLWEEKPLLSHVS